MKAYCWRWHVVVSPTQRKGGAVLDDAVWRRVVLMIRVDAPCPASPRPCVRLCMRCVFEGVQCPSTAGVADEQGGG